MRTYTYKGYTIEIESAFYGQGSKVIVYENDKTFTKSFKVRMRGVRALTWIKNKIDKGELK